MLLRTVPLPSTSGAYWDDFAWPDKAPGDDLDYALDAKAWLADAGRVLLDVDVVDVQGGIVVLGKALVMPAGGNSATGVTLQIAGGTPGAEAGVTLLLRLDAGRLLTVDVALPIGRGLAAAAAPFVPPDALTVGSVPLTIGGAPISP